MEYRYLKAFILTAQYASFSKAAEILGIAQSAVSRQIKLLEESLEEELIIRSSKKVLLTAKGQELFLTASNFDKMAMEIFEKEDTRPLRIGVLHGLLESWLTPIVNSYYKKHSRNIQIQVFSQPQLKSGLSEGKFDIIFTTENIQSELITSLKIMDEKFIVVSKEPIDMDQLDQYRWVVYGDHDNLFSIAEKKSRSVVSVHSITSIVNMVKNGVGIAAVPEHSLKKSDNLMSYEVPDFQTGQIYMATLNYKSMPVHINELAQIITN